MAQAEEIIPRAVGELDLSAAYVDHSSYLWLCLQRFGVSEADVPDLLQETFIIAHRRLHTVRSAEVLRSWLYGIALRVVKNHRRKRTRERPRASLDDERSRGPGPEEVAEQRDLRQLVRAVLDRLKPERRAVLVMYEVEGLSCVEIAEELHLSVGTVYSRLHRARRDFLRAMKRTQKERL